MATVAASQGGRLRPVGARTQELGLRLVVLGVALLFVLGVISGLAVADEGMFLLVILAATGLGVFLVRRFGTWARAVGIVLSLGAGFMLFWTAFGLFAPASFGDFVPGLAVPIGALLGAIGGIVSLVSGRRGTATADGTPGERRFDRAVVGLIAVAAAMSLALTLLGRETVDAAAAAGAAPVTMTGFEFDPGSVEVAAGEGARIVVHNRDAFLHDLTIPDVGEVTVTPGSGAILDVSSLAPGTYTFYCSLHSDMDESDPKTAGMAGTVIVQ